MSIFSDEIYRDGIDLTTEELYKKVEEKGNITNDICGISWGFH